ncbi:MAG: PQQ-binding-like beta-propeller repeat protein [Phycisphaerales bacterium]
MKQSRLVLVSTAISFAAALSLVLAGCSSTSSSDSNSGGSMSGASSTSAPSPDSSGGGTGFVETTRNRLDSEFVLGPSAADAMGYRVAWNRRAINTSSLEVLKAAIAGDSLFVIDDKNNLTRILLSDGRQVWTWPVAGTTDNILGVARARYGDTDLVVVATEGDVHLFEVNNGIQTDRQRLERVSSTAPVVYGQSIIYGSINGTLVWHHFLMGAFLRGYTMNGAILVDPVIENDVVVAVTDRGQVMAVDASSGRQLWSNYARDAILSTPAIGEKAVYTTSVDQYIRCYDIRSGRVLWSRLHEEPLRQPPVLIGDRVFVQTPDLGLCCYEALPFQDLDGELIWNTKEVTGTIIGRHRNRVLAWDADARTLAVVDDRTGNIVETISLPTVTSLKLSAFDSGDIYAISETGEITRAVAR